MLRFISIIMLAVVAFFLQSCMVSHKKSHIDFFNNPEFKNNATFISVNVPTFLARSYVKNALRENGDSEEIVQLVKKVSDVKVLIVEDSNANVLGNFHQYLNSNKFDEWMSVKQDGKIISINAKQTDDLIKHMIITVNDGIKEAVFVDVKGKFSPDDVSRIINATEKNKIKINRN